MQLFHCDCQTAFLVHAVVMRWEACFEKKKIIKAIAQQGTFFVIY